jgi:hypothetical protein
MIGAIREDKADAISELHLFAKASDSRATFPLKQANIHASSPAPLQLHSMISLKLVVL